MSMPEPFADTNGRDHAEPDTSGATPKRAGQDGAPLAQAESTGPARSEDGAADAPRQQGGFHTDAERRAPEGREAAIDRDRDYNPDGERADPEVRLGL